MRHRTAVPDGEVPSKAHGGTMHRFARTLIIGLLGMVSLVAGGGDAQKAGGQKGQAAAASGQKGGSTATSKRDTSTSQGSDYEGVACTGDLEGVGWCASD